MKHGTRADKREHLRRHRPREVSVSQGCKLMGLSRSTFYGMPSAALKAGELLARIGATSDEFEVSDASAALADSQGVPFDHKPPEGR